MCFTSTSTIRQRAFKSDSVIKVLTVTRYLGMSYIYTRTTHARFKISDLLKLLMFGFCIVSLYVAQILIAAMFTETFFKRYIDIFCHVDTLRITRKLFPLTLPSV